ncbi:hypothetical protein BDZ89DRAFT_946477, partial [Hymenopellis radicata]
TCFQAGLYFIRETDSWGLKSLVAAVVLCDGVHQALITHSVYAYLISNFDAPAVLNIPVWYVWSLFSTGVLSVALRSIIVSVVTPLQGVLWVRLIVLQETQVDGLFQYSQSMPLFESTLFRNLMLSITVNALAAGGDLLIAGTLVYLLMRSKTGFSRTERMIIKLVVLSVNTGLVTSVCAMASLVSILAWGHTFIYIAFFFCIGRLYSNSLLATLNLRQRIRASGEGTLDLPELTLPLHFAGSSVIANMGAWAGPGMSRTAPLPVILVL